jgi:predicted metallo-beta-lactamase superfamily hydrolase
MEFELVWFDSLGAKSSCTLVRTDHTILIDPGASRMHPGFPASDEDKKSWHREARKRVLRAASAADVIVVSHYHYDHFTDFEREMYEGKKVFVKNPNEFINDSQRQRAEHFFGNLYRHLAREDLKEVLEDPSPRDYGDPLDDIPEAMSRDFGDYQRRRRELLRKGGRWFQGRARRWSAQKRIPEMRGQDTAVRFADGQSASMGRTRIRFTRPLFHGIEFSRVGWVFSTVIDYEGEKLIHTSDVNGPIVEDYAEWIVEEDPDILILDGPMTYMLGYTLNLINLKRAVNNARRIVEEVDAELIVYDHHLPRESGFRERTREVWDTAAKLGRSVLTAAEVGGRTPVVLQASEGASDRNHP